MSYKSIIFAYYFCHCTTGDYIYLYIIHTHIYIDYNKSYSNVLSIFLLGPPCISNVKDLNVCTFITPVYLSNIFYSIPNRVKYIP